ncbi:MAG: DUF2442 domain-containing protein [Prevotellaceae bacterium]|jgi:hypothetical protein|nr:DUF2442 domain-containing protein [Prevotellaceae bacterium]
MKAKRIWFEDSKIYMEDHNGRILWQSMLYYSRLNEATDEERNTYELGHFGIRWETIDEDISYESFEYPNPEPTDFARFFMLHPELNAMAIAHRLNIPQNVMASYLCGIKNPSPEKLREIETAIREAGKQLCELQTDTFQPAT